MNVYMNSYYRFEVTPVLDSHPKLLFEFPTETRRGRSEKHVENFLFDDEADAVDYVENRLIMLVEDYSYGELIPDYTSPSVERIGDDKWIVGMYDAVLELHREDICFV